MHIISLYFQLYLKKFGYLEECADEESLAMSNPETVSFAIKAFQRFAGLNETGSCTISNI